MMIVIICLPYLAIGLFMMHVDISIQAWIWFVIIISLAFSSIVGPLREYKIHQAPCNGALFPIGPVVYLNHTMRQLVLGIKGEIEEMQFDWTDNNLRVTEHSIKYLNAKRQVLKQESYSVKKDKSLAKDPQNLKRVIDALNLNPSEIPLEQITEYLALNDDLKIKKRAEEKVILNEIETETNDQLEQFRNSLTEPEPNSIIVRKQGKEEIIVKPKIKHLADYGIITTDEQKNLLKNMYFYKVPLYHPETIEGYEYLQFNKAIFILPGRFFEILSSAPLTVYDYSDYACDASGCSVIWNCLGFVKGKYPLLLCTGSENMAKIQDAEAIKSQKLAESTLIYLRIKTLEYLLDELTHEQDPFIDRIKTLETQLQISRDKYNALLGEYMIDTMKVGNPIVEKENRVLHDQLSTAKKWKPISIILIVILIIAFIVIFAFVFPTAASLLSPPPI